MERSNNGPAGPQGFAPPSTTEAPGNTTQDPEPRPIAAKPSAARLVLATAGLAAWCALLVGLLEFGLFVVRAETLRDGFYRKSPHVLWMISAANLAIFEAVGLLLAILACRFPRLGRAVLNYVLATLSFLGPLLMIPGLKGTACGVLSIGLASWVVPWLRSRAEGFRTVVSRSLPGLILVFLGLVGFAYGRDYLAEHRAIASRPVPRQGVPNVLLVVMDTVRADATSLHRTDRDTTPNLSKLAARGTRFASAIATAPWTLPSHASMFTGHRAWELGVGAERPLDSKYPTLAEALGRRGYRTGGFVANTVFCTTEYGLNRGFSHYEDYVITPLEILRTSALGGLACHRLGTLLDRIYPALGLAPRHPFEVDQYRKTAARVNRDALRWIAADRGQPFFAFLNYMDAHDPYLLPPDARRHFGVRPKTLADYQTLRGWIAEERWVPNPAQVTLARDAYDDCIAYLDDQLGRLFHELEALGALENTIVIVTADHGEHFGEHQLDGKPVFGHRATLYQPEIHVPLFLVSPGKVPAGRVIPGPVSMRDLPATVLDLLGPDPRTAADFPGTSLARAWSPKNAESEGTAAEPVVSEFAFNAKLPPLLRYAVPSDGLRRTLIAEGTAYHRIGETIEELFDLETDPGETRNLVEAPEWQQRLGQSRQALDRSIPPAMKRSGDPQ